MGVVIRWSARRAESASGGSVPAKHDLQGVVRCSEDDVGHMVRALSAEVLLLREKANQFRGKGMVVTARVHEEGGSGDRPRSKRPVKIGLRLVDKTAPQARRRAG